MTVLTIMEIGNSEGVILPKELLAKLRLSVGDQFYVTETPDGIKLTICTEEFLRQIETAKRIMQERCDVLKNLPD